jgi:molybdopterin synthase sulfur carrier subunit
MEVQLILYATLSHLLPRESSGNACRMNVREGCTIKELLDTLQVPGDAVKVIFLNGRHARGDQVVQENDRVAVFPPVAGG